MPALDLNLRCLLPLQVHRFLSAAYGGGGLDCDPADDGLAGGYAAQNSPRPIAIKCHPAVPPKQSIVHLAALKAGAPPASPNFHRLHRSDAHEASRQICIQLVEYRLAQARRHSIGHYLHHTPQAVALFSHCLQPPQHPLCGSRIGAADGI